MINVIGAFSESCGFVLGITGDFNLLGLIAVYHLSEAVNLE